MADDSRKPGSVNPGPAGGLRPVQAPRVLTEEDKRSLVQFINLARIIQERGLLEGPMGKSPVEERVDRLEAAVLQGEGTGEDRIPSVVDVQAEMADELFGHTAQPATPTEPAREAKAGLVDRVGAIEDDLDRYFDADNPASFLSIVLRTFGELSARLDKLEGLISPFSEIVTALVVLAKSKGIVTSEELDAQVAEVRRQMEAAEREAAGRAGTDKPKAG